MLVPTMNTFINLAVHVVLHATTLRILHACVHVNENMCASAFVHVHQWIMKSERRKQGFEEVCDLSSDMYVSVSRVSERECFAILQRC